MQKSSFILVELLLSISILAFFSAFILYNKKDFNTEFQKLNSLENSFIKNDFTNLNIQNKQLELTINHSQKEYLNIKKVEYSDENIKIYLYKL